MDLGQRFRMGESQKRPITVTISLRPGRPCQFRELLDGEKFFNGPYAMVKLGRSRAAELGISDTLLWEGFDPAATVYRAELGEGTRQPARAELPRESWCQPNN